MALQILVFFDDFDYFLDVEDAYDGDHINISLRSCATAENVLRELTAPGLWNPSQVEPASSVGRISASKSPKSFMPLIKQLILLMASNAQAIRHYSLA